MKFKSASNRQYLQGTLKVLKRTIMFKATTGDDYEFSKDELADDIALPKEGTIFKKVKVNLSKDGNTFYGYGPSDGLHETVFSEFAHRKDQPPAPKFEEAGTGTRRDGTTYPKDACWTCTAILEIVSGEFAGCFVTLKLYYAFDKDERGMAYFNGGNKSNSRWETLCRLSGGDLTNAEIPFSSNILPELEGEFGQEHFMTRLENGWVTDVSDLPSGMKPAKVAAKKPAPAAKKVAARDEESNKRLGAKAPRKTEKEIQAELEGAGKPIKPPAKKAPVASKPIDTSKAKPLAPPFTPDKPAAKSKVSVRATPTARAEKSAKQDVEFPG